MMDIRLNQVIRPGAVLNESYDTLFVSEWEEYPWREQDFNGLVCICHRLKIRRVVFTKPQEGDISDFSLNNVMRWYNANGCPFLPHLKVIQMQHNSHHPVLATLARYSRVKELSWYLKSHVGHGQSMTIDHIFYYMDPELLRYNHSIQRIRFLVETWKLGKHKYRPIRINENASNIQLSEHGLRAFKDCSLWMKNNEIGWRNCRKSCLILIGLKKRGDRMFNLLYRDVMKIVVDKVWDTRGTKVWTE